MNNHNPVPLSDDWFEKFKLGDEAACQEAFHRFYRPIVYYANLILQGDELQAEDTAIESYQKAWRDRRKFATPKHLENYLYNVTRNACITRKRSTKALKERHMAYTNLIEAAEEIDLEKVQTMLIERMYHYLEQLPYGNILRMSYLEGMPTADIATALNTSENNVYILKSRALKELRRLMSQDIYLAVIIYICLHFCNVGKGNLLAGAEKSIGGIQRVLEAVFVLD